MGVGKGGAIGAAVGPAPAVGSGVRAAANGDAGVATGVKAGVSWEQPKTINTLRTLSSARLVRHPIYSNTNLASERLTRSPRWLMPLTRHSTIFWEASMALLVISAWKVTVSPARKGSMARMSSRPPL